MIPRIALVAAIAVIVALALAHPARGPVVQTTAAVTAARASLAPPRHARHRRGSAGMPGDDAIVVYVAGAVRKPGLYRLQPGDRNAQAVALAGGLSASADAAGINLAARAQDGDEVYVPRAGESRHSPGSSRHSRRHSARAPPSASVDVNRADASELAAIPGIGNAIAARIVELREREGAFASLDELLDVAGMTPTRLERARPYLRQP
jgi:competence protein ComEA